MANRYYYNQNNDNDNAAYELDGGYSGNGLAIIGKYEAAGQKSAKGAFRFINVTIPQGSTVSAATLKVAVSNREASGTLRSKTNGIKETNTGAFSSSPFGRTQTTAQTTRDSGVPSLGTTYDIDVTSIVNEIVGQGGWSSGNAMGFFVDNNGSDDHTYVGDGNLDTLLEVQLSALPDFTPTPSTIAAPTFPNLSSYGIKVSMPGVNVQDAAEDELYFTTRKKQLRVALEEEILNVFTKAHSLGYAPCVLAYFNDTGKKYLMNRQIGPVEVGNYVASNASNVIFSNNTGVSIYYYMFIDPLT